jgi:hypothetical protein
MLSRTWKEYLENVKFNLDHMSEKGLVSRICNELLQFKNKKRNNTILKGTKLFRSSSKEDIQ